MKKLVLSVMLVCISVSLCVALPKNAMVNQGHGGLVVSENRRFLQHEDGTPFFYLGDTAWELFHSLDRDDVELYLRTRADQGYNVIQAVALAELKGHTKPNAYGYLPFVNSDPAKPAVKDGPRNDYWDNVDYIVDKANSLGMYVGLLPTWGAYWADKNTLQFTTEDAFTYGKFIGERYKDNEIIWILGGDRKVENDGQKEIIRAMARGLKAGDGGRHLMTFHPRGASGSADVFHDEPWLDFNMRQNGHSTSYTERYHKTLQDYKRTPVKPVMDGEPLYEDHPISFSADKNGHSIAADVRRAFYWNVFEGAFGHTYGHHSVWQMYDPNKGASGKNFPLLSWKEAVHQPGAQQMQYGKNLILSRPFFSRIPAPEAVVSDAVDTAMPGAGAYRFTATRDSVGSWMMVYVPVGRPFTVDTSFIKGDKINAWWFNPRNGEATRIGTLDNTGRAAFISPEPGELSDWVLVLDNATCRYKAPGKQNYK